MAGLILFGLAGAVRAFTNNRVVRGRVRLTMGLGVLFVGINAALAASDIVRPEMRPLVVSISQLLFAYALIHFVVLVLVNPLRADRAPDYFPTIVQDVLVFVLFAMVATLVMEEKFLTTSAVGAVVAGLALQDTLGNLVSGLAIQVEKPFHVGHWISSGSWEGEVVEITWRATKLRTRHGNQVSCPTASWPRRRSSTTRSRPRRRASRSRSARLQQPAEYREGRDPRRAGPRAAVLKSPAPAVHVISFDASSILHRARFWIQHFPMDELITDRVRTGIDDAFKRENIDIPYPTAVEYGADLQAPGPTLAAIKTADVCWPAPICSGCCRSRIARRWRRPRRCACSAPARRSFGRAMPALGVVVCDGRVRVSLDPGDVELAVLERGAYFGEMSLFTGDPRTASVRALGDRTAVEITSDAFGAFALNQPRGRAHRRRNRRAARRYRARPGDGRHCPAAESASSLVARVKVLPPLEARGARPHGPAGVTTATASRRWPYPL